MNGDLSPDWTTSPIIEPSRLIPHEKRGSACIAEKDAAPPRECPNAPMLLVGNICFGLGDPYLYG